MRWRLSLLLGLAVVLSAACMPQARLGEPLVIPLDTLCKVTADGLKCDAAPPRPPDPPIPPTTGGGTWTLVSQGASGARNWYYNLGAACGNGELWMAWSGVTFRYSPSTNRWTEDATVNSMGWRENFAVLCDDSGTVQITPGTSGPPDWSGWVTYDRTSRTYAKVSGGGCNAHAALGYDATRSRMLTWGGWSTNCPIQQRALTATSWTPLNAAGGLPPLTQEDSRETSRRGGVDRTTGDAYVLADDRELWRYTASGNRWDRVATTGPKPPAYAVVAYHAAARTLVAVSGCPGLNDSDCGSGNVRGTWLLDTASSTWRTGPQGDAAPEAMPMAKRHAIYDAHGQRVLLLTASPTPTNGQLGTAVWAWTPDGGTPPPTATYGTTVAATGAGTASVSPTGPQPEGTTRVLTATATGAGVFKSWTPSSPCAQLTFPQPPSDVACTAAFTSGGEPPIPAGTWTTRALCALNECPFPKDRQSKDVQWTWKADTGEMIMGTGDFSTGLGNDSGATPIYAYTMATGTWRTISTICHAPGKLTQNHQQDKGPFSYDSKRKWLWLSTSTPFPDQRGQPCNLGTPSGSTYTQGTLAQDLSGPTPGDWALILPNAVGALSSSAYNVKTDELLYMSGPSPSDCAGVMVVHRLSDHAQTRYPMCLRPSPPFNSTSGGWAYAEYAERAYLAWDEAGQAMYGVFVHRRLNPAGTILESKAVAYKFSRATASWAALTPDPPLTPGTPLTPSNMTAVWVDLEQRLYYAVVSDPCAQVRQLLAIRPGDAAWESIEVHPDVHGSTFAVDQASGTLFLAGSVFCSNYTQKDIFLWRRGEAGRRR
jgi:hypothetical protein